MSFCFLGHEFGIVDVLERAGWHVCVTMCVLGGVGGTLKCVCCVYGRVWAEKT